MFFNTFIDKVTEVQSVGYEIESNDEGNTDSDHQREVGVVFLGPVASVCGINVRDVSESDGKQIELSAYLVRVTAVHRPHPQKYAQKKHRN